MIFLPWVVKEKIEVGPGQKIRDGSVDPGRIHYPDPSRPRIFVPGHSGTYLRTIYSGSVQRHCLRTRIMYFHTLCTGSVTAVPGSGYRIHRGLRTTGD